MLTTCNCLFFFMAWYGVLCITCAFHLISNLYVDSNIIKCQSILRTVDVHVYHAKKHHPRTFLLSRESSSNFGFRNGTCCAFTSMSKPTNQHQREVWHNWFIAIAPPPPPRELRAIHRNSVVMRTAWRCTTGASGMSAFWWPKLIDIKLIELATGRDAHDG